MANTMRVARPLSQSPLSPGIHHPGSDTATLIAGAPGTFGDVDGDNNIGEFLRARREQVRPEDVGLPDYGRRRVPGLRREELATLAGVSADYYVRLEQGRERHPSEQVIEALARALQLDREATAHLHDLARPEPRRRRAARRTERVRPQLKRLMEAWPQTPAVILGRHMDVLASNPLATALHGGWESSTNMVRLVFLDPEGRERYPDWEEVASNTVAVLRGMVGPDLDDPRLTELIGELSLKSGDFRRLWARHDVSEKTHGRKRFVHPMVGELDLAFESFTVAGAVEQMLVVYIAEPGSASEQALALLASIVAGAKAGSTR
jgi:transcriptional regulator with XRE-family HTH domain